MTLPIFKKSSTSQRLQQVSKRGWRAALACFMGSAAAWVSPICPLYADGTPSDEEELFQFEDYSRFFEAARVAETCLEETALDSEQVQTEEASLTEAFQVTEELEEPSLRLDDEQRIVSSIDVIFADREETSFFTKQKVLALMKTVEGRYFSQTDFDQDLKTLVRDYDHVEPTVRREGKKLLLTLRIWPKPTISSISWTGNQKVAVKTLERELDIKPKSRFERTQFHQAFQKLKTFYVKKGFFEAELDYHITFNEAENDVCIAIEVKEGRAGKIEEVILSGFTCDEERELTANMITKRYRVFVSWLTGDGIYDQDAVKMDEFRILEFLHNKGYADAKVDIDVRESRFANRIEIDISAEKGTQYLLGDIHIEGNTILDQDELERCMTVHSNGIYSPEKIRETISRIQSALGRYGYIDAVVDVDAKLLGGECKYDLRFNISPGAQYRVGLIRVVGNLCTQTRVILHETLLVPGEIFDLDKLRITEARLFNIGYFKNVNIYPVESEEVFGDDMPVRDVVIEVEETGTGNINFFGGFSTTESLFCGLSITETNFNHAGIPYARKKGLCALRGGGEYLSLTTNIGLKSNSVQLSWTQPHFNDTQWSVGFDIDRSVNKQITDDYEIKSVGGTLHATYPLTPFLRFSEHYRIQDSVVLVRDYQKDDQGRLILDKKGKLICTGKKRLRHKNKDKDKTACATPADNNGCAKTLSALERLAEEEANTPSHKDGLISAVGAGLIYDSTDSPTCPTHGARNRLDLEYIGLGGQFHFWTLAWNNTYYQPVTARGTLKFRADMNFIKPLGSTKRNDIPLDERLFLGGDNGVRGYRPYAIGPKFVDPQNLDCSKAPKGGLSMQLLSVEYNYRFNMFDGFLFYDAGGLSFDVWHFDRLRTSAGFGVRFQLLPSAPPVTLGIGYPINPRCRGDVKRFFWSMGGRF